VKLKKPSLLKGDGGTPRCGARVGARHMKGEGKKIDALLGAIKITNRRSLDVTCYVGKNKTDGT